MRSVDDKFSFGVWRRDVQRRHFERTYHEVAVILEGEVEITEEDGEVFVAKAGDILVTPKGSKGYWKNLTPVKKGLGDLRGDRPRHAGLHRPGRLLTAAGAGGLRPAVPRYRAGLLGTGGRPGYYAYGQSLRTHRSARHEHAGTRSPSTACCSRSSASRTSTRVATGWGGPPMASCRRRPTSPITEDATHTPNANRIAFWAADREKVDRVANLVRSIGANVTSGPQEYPEYGGSYYAVYFEDPCGNRLEVVLPHDVRPAAFGRDGPKADEPTAPR